MNNLRMFVERHGSGDADYGKFSREDLINEIHYFIDELFPMRIDDAIDDGNRTDENHWRGQLKAAKRLLKGNQS